MKRIQIISYFSLPTDLAEQMRGWPEFVAGDGYSVDLKDTASGEVVSVRYVDGDEDCYVTVETSSAGTLFDRALGRVVSALAAHSDNLLVSKKVAELQLQCGKSTVSNQRAILDPPQVVLRFPRMRWPLPVAVLLLTADR